MPLQTKLSGTWKNTLTHVRVSGAWKQSPQMYVRVGGGWKPLYTFSWEAGAWSSCSASCGGGTQTRDVKCRRSDGQYFNDAVGARFAGEKPAASQPCNTQACSECRYDAGNVWTVATTLMNAGGECLGWTIGTVLWDGETVYADDGGETATVNGYTYKRTTLQSETGAGGCPSKHGQKYTVCREPV